MSSLPLLLPADILLPRLGESGLFLADLSPAHHYRKLHLPTAIHIDYNNITHHAPPVSGLLPPVAELERLMQQLGLQQHHHVVAYDEEGGGRAARFLWTLEACGWPLEKLSLLDGGIVSWYKKRYPLNTEYTPMPAARNLQFTPQSRVVAKAEDILQELHTPQLLLLDSRSAEEYSGQVKLALHAGHIPGAVHYEWSNAMHAEDKSMRPAQDLHDELTALGIDDNKHIVVYCQTHHRSSFSYIMLRHLGFPNVKGYPGSWSDWGNQAHLPFNTLS